MLDFNDTKTAFARKSDGEMRNALMLFRMMKRPGLVKAGKRACGAAARLHLPVGWIVKPTLYRQFVGGETLEECGPTVDGLERAGVKAALDYSAESEQTPVGIEAVFAETERSIEYAARNKNVAYEGFKPSTLTKDTLLAKASEHRRRSVPDSMHSPRVSMRSALWLTGMGCGYSSMPKMSGSRMRWTG